MPMAMTLEMKRTMAMAIQSCDLKTNPKKKVLLTMSVTTYLAVIRMLIKKCSLKIFKNKPYKIQQGLEY